jgi:hypothetical protein
MANNYTLLSFAIDTEWSKQAKEDFIDIIESIDSFSIDEAPDWYKTDFTAIIKAVESEDTGPAPSWYVEGDIDECFTCYIDEELCGISGVDVRLNESDNILYIFYEESANIEAVAAAILDVQRHYQIDTPITFEYAHICDKPRTGEFGGGVISVTKDGILSWNTGEGVPSPRQDAPNHSGVASESRVVLVLSGTGEKELAKYISGLKAFDKQTLWILLGKGYYAEYRKNTLRDWLFINGDEDKLLTNFLERLDEPLYRYIRFGGDYSDYAVKGTYNDPFKLDFSFTPERIIGYELPN